MNEPMNSPATLGRSEVRVPRMGVGVMTWGDPSGRARWTPAKLAYGGGPASREEEQRAFDASMAAGVTLFDTAEMYGAGASERRLGELSRGRDVVIATKFPPSMLSRADAEPRALARSLELLQRSSIDLYMHHFPSRRVSIPKLMNLMADAVEQGEDPGSRCQQLLGRPDAARPPCSGRPRRAAGLESGRVLAAPSPARDRRRPRGLPRARGSPSSPTSRSPTAH